MQNVFETLTIIDSEKDEGIEELYDLATYERYLKTMSYFHFYSRRNILLIFKQMPTATKLAEFSRWKEYYGRKIIRGSKTIKIYIPIVKEPKTKLVEKVDLQTNTALLDSDGKKIMEEVIVYVPPQFKQSSVLDISQTEGEPILRLAGDVLTDDAIRQAFADAVFFNSAVDAILIDSTMLREQVPGIIYHSVLQMFLGHDLADAATHNFIIKSIACVVCYRFGFEYGFTENDMVPKRETDAFIDMLELIRSHASELISAIENEFVNICNERSLNPLTLPAAPPPTDDTISLTQSPVFHEVQPELPYTKELRTITRAGVNFAEFKIMPGAPDASVVEQPVTPSAQLPAEKLTPSVQPSSRILTPSVLDIDVYPFSIHTAQEYDQIEIYELSQATNIACAAAIDKLIIANKKGPGKYDLVAAAEAVTKEFGKKRLLWVLAVFLLHKPNGVTEENITWAQDALGYDDNGTPLRPEEQPSFALTTDVRILNIFVKRFKDVLQRRPTFKERMERAGQQSREQLLSNILE